MGANRRLRRGKAFLTRRNGRAPKASLRPQPASKSVGGGGAGKKWMLGTLDPWPGDAGGRGRGGESRTLRAGDARQSGGRAAALPPSWVGTPRSAPRSSPTIKAELRTRYTTAASAASPPCRALRRGGESGRLGAAVTAFWDPLNRTVSRAGPGGRRRKKELRGVPPFHRG